MSFALRLISCIYTTRCNLEKRLQRHGAVIAERTGTCGIHEKKVHNSVREGDMQRRKAPPYGLNTGKQAGTENRKISGRGSYLKRFRMVRSMYLCPLLQNISGSRPPRCAYTGRVTPPDRMPLTCGSGRAGGCGNISGLRRHVFRVCRCGAAASGPQPFRPSGHQASDVRRHVPARYRSAAGYSRSIPLPPAEGWHCPARGTGCPAPASRLH